MADSLCTAMVNFLLSDCQGTLQQHSLDHSAPLTVEPWAVTHP